jgi:hypothetical protein
VTADGTESGGPTAIAEFVALVTKAQSFVLPAAARHSLTFAVVASVVAVVLAIATYANRLRSTTHQVPGIAQRGAQHA